MLISLFNETESIASQWKLTFYSNLVSTHSVQVANVLVKVIYQVVFSIYPHFPKFVDNVLAYHVMH